MEVIKENSHLYLGSERVNGQSFKQIALLTAA